VLLGWPNRLVGDVILLQLMTGSRPGEVKKMQWPHLRLDSTPAYWDKPNWFTKQRKPHHLVLSQEAADLLRAIQTRRDQPFVEPERFKGNNAYYARLRWEVAKTSIFVFPSTVPGKPIDQANFDRSFRRILKAAGIGHLRLHDLRHSAASFLVQKGYSMPQIGKLLGHSSALTTERYAHLTDRSTEAAAETLANVVDLARHRKRA